jgi:hypothetical protein
LSSQFGQTRGCSIPFGANTRTYSAVTNDPQFSHVGIDAEFVVNQNNI